MWYLVRTVGNAASQLLLHEKLPSFPNLAQAFVEADHVRLLRPDPTPAPLRDDPAFRRRFGGTDGLLAETSTRREYSDDLRDQEHLNDMRSITHQSLPASSQQPRPW